MASFVKKWTLKQLSPNEMFTFYCARRNVVMTSVKT